MPSSTLTHSAALRLGLLAGGAVLILLGLQPLTAQQVAARQAQQYQAELQQLLPGAPVQVTDRRMLPGTALGVARPVQLLTLLQAGQPRAWVFDLITPHGYSGDIRLLVALAPDDGRILGVRVLHHRETPGLGDRIEPQRTHWLTQFLGRSPALPASAWNWRQAGGTLDSLSGATISALAVRTAIHHCEIFYVAHLHALPIRD